MHDTVGVISQIVLPHDPDYKSVEELAIKDGNGVRHFSDSIVVNMSTENFGSVKSQRERSRRFNVSASDNEDLEPFYKKLRAKGALLPLESSLRNCSPENLRDVLNLDRSWVLSHFLDIQGTPMWTGYNSRMLEDYTPYRRVGYLKSLNKSPTDPAVIRKTLDIALAIQSEVGQRYIEVTYDLNIATEAYKIQDEFPTKYKTIIVHLGFFHIQMAYFHAIGKFIDGSGFTDVMIDSDIIASGSVSGFLKGKHFNRCKRLHPIMSLSLQYLLFEKFLVEERCELKDSIKTYLRAVQHERTPYPEITDEDCLDILTEYQKFEDDVYKGLYGKTPQFYTIYIKLIEYYFLLSRAIRTGDFELLKYSLQKIVILFFTFNHQNYCRWLVKYLNSLYNVDATHPGLKDNFKKGSFSVRRTSVPFIASPMDYITETTQNLDASDDLKGMSHFKHSESTKQKWSITHGARSFINSFVFDMLDMRKKQDISNELQANNIRRSRLQVLKVVDTFKNYLNPFSVDINKEDLVNICNGEAVGKETCMFLTEVENIGFQQYKNFIDKCSTDETHFNKPIKRNTLNTFATRTKNHQSVKVAGKVSEIKSQRDLFGHLLTLALKYKIDIFTALSFPISSFPSSLCHSGGIICKTEKAALLHYFIKKFSCETEVTEDILIYDGFALLHTLMCLPSTYGEISEYILNRISKQKTKRIDLVFDTYRTPSIKDYEHHLRKSTKSNFKITSRSQSRNRDFHHDLKNEGFKSAFVQFLISDWKMHDRNTLIKDKIIRVNYDKCHVFKVNEASFIESHIDVHLDSEQDEADTKIIQHVCNYYQTDSNNIAKPSIIKIRASDTDILVIMLGNICNMVNKYNEVWMDAGVGQSRRLINVTKICNELGPEVCKALPGVHAISGCDFNPCFYRKGKTKPLQLIIDNPEFCQAFIDIGDLKKIEYDNYDECIKTPLFKTIEKFVCALYGYVSMNSVHDVRYKMFLKTYKNSKIDELLKLNVKNFDPSNIPPCRCELFMQFLRAAFISSIWQNAYKGTLYFEDATKFGWKLMKNEDKDEYYDFDWFYGDQMPKIVDIIIEKSSDDEMGRMNEENDSLEEILSTKDDTVMDDKNFYDEDDVNDSENDDN